MFGFKKLLYGNSLSIPREVLTQLKTAPVNTPDAAELHNRKHNLVFLYGNEMTGGRDNNRDIKPIYKDVFTCDPYVMVNVKKGEMVAPVAFNPPTPIVTTKRTRAYAYRDIKDAATAARICAMRPAPIKGELYQLTGAEVEELDKEYSNTVFFRRVRVKVRIEHFAISKHIIGKEEESRMSEALYHPKRVHMYVGRYSPFSSSTILNSSELLKERPHNSNYASRYFYTRQDW